MLLSIFFIESMKHGIGFTELYKTQHENYFLVAYAFGLTIIHIYREC